MFCILNCWKKSKTPLHARYRHRELRALTSIPATTFRPPLSYSYTHPTLNLYDCRIARADAQPLPENRPPRPTSLFLLSTRLTNFPARKENRRRRFTSIFYNIIPYVTTNARIFFRTANSFARFSFISFLENSYS